MWNFREASASKCSAELRGESLPLPPALRQLTCRIDGNEMGWAAGVGASFLWLKCQASDSLRRGFVSRCESTLSVCSVPLKVGGGKLRLSKGGTWGGADLGYAEMLAEQIPSLCSSPPPPPPVLE